MSRYTGPKFKLSRRVGISLSGNGKDLKRPFPPGQHGPGQRKKMSGYGVQLNEKQKLRHMYGLNEKQFRNLFDKASKLKGISGENFMVLLESRLDNLVYRLGLANSRAGARQLVSHGHVTVNGKKVDIASYIVSTGDVIALRERSKGLSSVKEALAKSDIVYVTRIQRERFEDPEEYEKLKGTYIIDRNTINEAKKGITILHPLPRVNEISTDVDDYEGAAYFRQAHNGMYIRMALLSLVSGSI